MCLKASGELCDKFGKTSLKPCLPPHPPVSGQKPFTLSISMFCFAVSQASVRSLSLSPSLPLSLHLSFLNSQGSQQKKTKTESAKYPVVGGKRNPHRHLSQKQKAMLLSYIRSGTFPFTEENNQYVRANCNSDAVCPCHPEKIEWKLYYARQYCLFPHCSITSAQNSAQHTAGIQ